MAGTFRARPSHPNATSQTHNSIVTLSQPTYPEFPTSLHHVNSTYDTSGYEPSGQRHGYSDAAQHVDHTGIDLQTSPIHQHDFGDNHDAHGLPDKSYSPPVSDIHGAQTEQFRMLPPSVSKHASWQALYDYAQSHAAAEGYALSINTTAKNRSRIKLACVCYGQPKNTHKLTAETRIRKNRVSYKTGCKMWVEGRKLEDGTWLLRVGESQHNHPGRPSEGWAAQRKRTWGVVGGRIGVGGVTAQEEQARLSGTSKTPTEHDQGDGDDNEDEEDDGAARSYANKPSHLQRGGLVWKIVEQEMLRKSELFGSRDGSVDRTVEELQARLPGIHIFKRDVYNIRAAIKRAWKAAEQHMGDSEIAEAGAQDEAAAVEEEEEEEEDEDEDEDEDEKDDDDDNDIEQEPAVPHIPSQAEYHRHSLSSQIKAHDFVLNPSLRLPDPPSSTMSTTQVLSASSAEVEHLRKEVGRLKTMLGEKTKEVMEKNIVIAGLRSQLEYMSMAMLPS